jgi:septal ring factor EnvC (AmiA/AmiB activator)
MTLRWSMEAAWAAVAVVASVGGGLYTTVYHSGASATQISQIESRQDATDAHVAKHDDQLSTIQQQNAASAQALSDIKEQLNRIEKKL